MRYLPEPHFLCDWIEIPLHRVDLGLPPMGGEGVHFSKDPFRYGRVYLQGHYPNQLSMKVDKSVVTLTVLTG